MQAIHGVPAAFLKAQLQSVLDDIGVDAVKIGMLATTRMACPPAIMDQEWKFLAALGKAVRYEAMSNGRLVLRDSSGAELVRFSRM